MKRNPNKRMAYILLTIILMILVNPSFVFALMSCHGEIKIAPKTHDNVTVTANGARYRFLVDITPGGHSPNPDGGYVYANDGYKYDQSKITWSINPSDSGFTTIDEGPCTENNFLTSARWQTPTNDQTYTITVSGERWPYTGSGGSGPYDPSWSSDRNASLQRPEIFDVYVKVGTNEYRQGSEVAIPPPASGQTYSVEGKARDGQGQIQYGEVEIFWKVKNDPDIEGYRGTVNPTSSKTDGTFMAKTNLTPAVNNGSSHIVTGQDKSSDPSSTCDSGKVVVGFKVEITDVHGIGSTDKFIPLSSDSSKNKATIKYKISPKDYQLDSIKIQVFKSNGTTKIYEQTYTDVSYTKYTGTDLTITWDGSDNQTANDYADPNDNTHRIKLIGQKDDDTYETDPLEDINVVPLIEKVFPTHSSFSASAVAPQTLTITTIVKGKIDNTGTYRYYTESGNTLSIWDGNHYHDNNSSANYPGSPLSYWVELLNQVSLDPEDWDENKLGSLDYTWTTIRGPNGGITDSDNDGVVNKTFSNAGTDVYRVTVTNKIETTTLQQKQSPAEQTTSSPQTVTYVENINDAYMVHLKEDSTSDAYSWATSFLTTPYWQRSAPKDYHGIDCSGLVHASNQLKGGWDTVSNTEANVFLTSSSYSSALGSMNPTTDVSAARNDWVGIDAKTGGGGFDGTWNHIIIVYGVYEFVESYTLTNGQKYKFIHARGSTGVQKKDQALYPVNPPSGTAWNIIFRRPNY